MGILQSAGCMGGVGTPAVYIGSSWASRQIGDLVIYASYGGGDPTTGGGSWTSLHSGAFSYRFLTAGDVGGGFTGEGGTIAIYRNVESFVGVSTAGFIKSQMHAGILVLAAGSNGPGTISPAIFSTRANVATNVSSQNSIRDRLEPANAAYVDGTAITRSDPSDPVFAVYEFRSL